MKKNNKKILVTGACGFIGYCLCKRLIDEGYHVVGLDNLSRAGTQINKVQLMAHANFSLFEVDISRMEHLKAIFLEIGKVEAIFHMAAQVAVTLSYTDREKDFENNARASFNVVECAKRYSPEAYCLYASTNKVYGHIEVSKPVGLEMPLHPYTPYGVSKAVGELYFTEYGRPEIGLQTCSFRQSCIYGHHQYGVEDQGWVAWFAIANLLGKSVTIYGNGEQTRDLLYIDDLIDLYLMAYHLKLTGVYPVGGGEKNAISVKEGLELIQKASGLSYPTISNAEMRPGDQPYFIADISWTKKAAFNWSAKTAVEDGIVSMMNWMKNNIKEIEEVLSKK